MRSVRCACAAAIAVMCLAAAPAAAQGATVILNKTCYVSEGDDREPITINASGFTPGAPVTITLNGRAFARIDQAGPDGTISGNVAAPSQTANEVKYTLRVTDGPNTAVAILRVTRVRADFFPRAGRPQSLRARFTISGVGAAQRLLRANGRLGHAFKHAIYAHWVGPGNRWRGTKFVGRLSGPCGKLVTSRIRVLPFRSRFGDWLVHFDTRRSFTRNRRLVPERVTSSFVIRPV